MVKMDLGQVQMTLEDATQLFIGWLRKPEYNGHAKYGYDIYIPSLIRTYLEQKQVDHFQIEAVLTKLSPLFYNAAWELCRRGIIRPGVCAHGKQATEDGSAGNGYSITPFGKIWLEEEANSDFVPTEPERFAQMLEPYRDKFGASFHQRTQEAIRCYGAHVYLACCAMCGAAAESILLATAIVKTNDEAKILTTYRSAGGRQKIENILIGQSNQQLKDEIKGFNSLLKYWRDEAAHGHITKINENEAYTAIAMLLRFSMFITNKWNELTSNHGGTTNGK